MVISVFTPSHNAEYLPAVFETLKGQTHKDWQWIVLLNNGAEFQCTDPRVIVLRDPVESKSVGLLKRKACQAATGDIVFELDHDDLLAETALEECAQAFSDPTVDFVYSNPMGRDERTGENLHFSPAFGWQFRTIHSPQGDLIEIRAAEPMAQNISRIWFAPDHFRAWRKSFYDSIGGHNPALELADDHDLLCRTWLAGKMVHIDKPLYYYRIHGGNTWLTNMDKIEAAMWRNHDKYIEAIAQKWRRERGLLSLDLCGGIDGPPGYIHVDKHGGDVKADLDQRWPFKDNSVGLIRANDAIEHLRDCIHTMNEAWRVLAHGGFFLITVPSTNGVGAWCDPTHVSFWNKRSFRYWTEKGMQKYLEGAGARGRFQVLKLEDVTLYDNVPYVQAHLIALKEAGPRFHGLQLI